MIPVQRDGLESLVMPKQAANQPGWGALPCPECHGLCAHMMDLGNLSDFVCDSCDAQFDRRAVENELSLWRRWEPVLRWLDIGNEVARQEKGAC